MIIVFVYDTYGLVQGEAVVDAGRQGDHVPFAQEQTDPPVLLVPDVKERLTIQDVSDLIIQMQVLGIEPLLLTNTRIGRACYSTRQQQNSTKHVWKNNILRLKSQMRTESIFCTRVSMLTIFHHGSNKKLDWQYRACQE